MADNPGFTGGWKGIFDAITSPWTNGQGWHTPSFAPISALSTDGIGGIMPTRILQNLFHPIPPTSQNFGANATSGGGSSLPIGYNQNPIFGDGVKPQVDDKSSNALRAQNHG